MKSPSVSRWIELAVLCAAMALPLGVRARPGTNQPYLAASLTNPATAYTGSVSCRVCHEKFYKLWAPSHHGLAMQPYSIARTNLTEQKAPIKVGNATYQTDTGSGLVISRGPGGEKRYPIEQALGGKNVFYFLTPFDRGRLQVLPVAYDLRRREWFDTADSAIRHFGGPVDEPFHWTEPAYTFNTACFNCHVSQLTNHYSLATDSYHTTWAEPGINCETCHGPASEHVRAARQTPAGQPLKDLHLITFDSFTSDQVNSACASCHARILPLTNSFSPGDRFFDHFGLVALENPDFYPDGRELGEDFTYTGWRLNPCLKSGKFDCVDCHTSSGRYRFKGEQANDACLPCHEDRVKDAAGHSHHKAGTDAAKCVSCHMPKTEFARMIRTDHSLRPPMPAATIAFGSPNACNLCHTNQNAKWADQQVRKWQTRDYQAPVLQRGSWIASARKHDWSKLAEIEKYLSSTNREEIWASSLIQLLRGCEDDSKWPGIVACLKDSSPLVRAAAVEALGDSVQAATIAALLAATRDDYRLVRLRAAHALSGVPNEMIPETDRNQLQAATAELLASFAARPDDPASYHNLGNFRLERHELPEAIAAFQSAIRLRPDDVSPLVNISVAYNMAGRNEQAEASLRQALRLDPTNAAIHLNLGMLLAEMQQPANAEKAFRAALKGDPKSAQAAFNLGVLLANTNPDESLAWCRRAAELRPREPRYPYTLAFYEFQRGKTNEAVRTLEQIVANSPAHTESLALLAEIYQDQHKIDEALAICRRALTNEALTDEQRAPFLAKIQLLSRTSAKP